MTAVLVHGVPETSVVWDLMVDALIALGHDEPVRLSPPGFGSPVPDGWTATMDEYKAWLVEELEKIGHPVDLVGHDWGGGHVMHVMMDRPDLVRTWVADSVGVYHDDYAWGGLAEQWQTPGLGEEVMAAIIAQPSSELASFLVALGMNAAIADRLVPGIDDTMGKCILGVYRSAVQPAMRKLGKQLETAAARPGMAMFPTEDQGVGTDEQRRHSAVRAGARVEFLPGRGHFWMTEDPRGAASLLSAFWKSAG